MPYPFIVIIKILFFTDELVFKGGAPWQEADVLDKERTNGERRTHGRRQANARTETGEQTDR